MTQTTFQEPAPRYPSCRKPFHSGLTPMALRKWCVRAIAVLCCFAISPAPPSARAQLAAPFAPAVARTRTAGDDGPDGPFQPPSHEASRHFENAKKLLEDGHYSEGLQSLDEIMQKDEDFFLRPAPGQSSHRGLKEEVQRLISQQPAAGLEAYEMLFGAKAQRMLSDALAANDIEAVGQVARRYFNTKAGNSAALLVGLWDLDHNQPLAAALCLQRLREAASGAKYEPSLSVLLAFCWLRGGQEERARNVLIELKKKDSGATIQVGGKSVRLFTDDSKAIAWLNDTLGKDRMPQGLESLQWAMFRGNPARNAVSAGGAPLLNPHWRAPTAENPTAVVSSRQANLDRNVPIMPVAQPLAVADVVLMRTEHGLLAVNFVTGKRIWAVGHLDGEADAAANSQRNNGLQPQADPSLAERLWENATLGILSSDGQYVFMVEDSKPEGFSNPQQQIMMRGGFGWRGQMERMTNELAAYDIPTQGKIKWRVGGSGDHRDLDSEPKLAGACFLGPPLPLDGQLYVLAEMKEEISLVVLDAKTGKLQWQQQLVTTADSNMNGFLETYRRMAGATPSFADGVLVCPTSAGAVVAVDLATHELLWGYEYPPTQNVGNQQQQIMAMRFAMQNGGMAQSTMGDRWADATVTLVDGRALVTPVEGDKEPLFCLSLIDGKLLWKSDREDNLYVGGVQDGKVILVGKSKVHALNLADGKSLWSLDLDAPKAKTGAGADGSKPDATKPPDVINPFGTKTAGVAASRSGAMPAGRGFLSGGCYFLPLSTGEVAYIDLATAKIVSRARSRKGYIPGNLICYKGDVISLGVDYLDAFYQIEPLAARVAARLKENPGDPQALADRGEIELEAGKLDDAIRDIHLAFDKDDPAHSLRALTRGLLVDAMLAALGSDFKTYRVNISELEKLIESDNEQGEFLRLLARGLEKSKDRLHAVDAYLKLADLKSVKSEPESVEPNLSVRRDRWVEARMEALYLDAPPADRAKIDEELSMRLKSILAATTEKDGQLRAFARYFSFHPTADAARSELYRLLSSNAAAEHSSLIERESLLSELERSTDPALRRAAIAQMAALLKPSRPEDAALYYRRLKTEFADQVCLDGKTGKQIVAELAPASAEVRAIAESNVWPSGAVKHDAPRSVPGMNFQRPVPIAWHGDRGPFFQSSTFQFDMQQQQIVGRDGMGREKFRIPMNEVGKNRFIYQQMNPNNPGFVAAKGHVLFVDTGSQFLALDTLRSPSSGNNLLLWQQDLFEMTPNVLNGPTQIQHVNIPWGPARQIPQYNESTVIGTVGPITDRCVCISRSRDLIALDPLTGATLWTWHGVPPGAEVFGDNDALIVAPRDGLDSTVLRTTDGHPLGTCNVPPIDRRGGYHGRRVLTWRSAEGAADGKFSIRLADPWKGQDLMLGDFAPHMKGKIVDDEALAILEPSGRFRILSLNDGSKLVDEQLEPEPSMGDIVVEATPDQFLLVANRGAGRRTAINNSRYMPMNMQGFDASVQLVSGSVYAFHRASGKPIWSVPALVEHQYMVLDQGRQLPVILFVRPPRRDRAQPSNGEPKGTILCLDRRTGRVLLDEEIPLQINNYHFNMTGDRQANTINLTASNHALTMQFTDDPVPPEPPYQAGLASLKGRMAGTPAKSVLGAIRAAGDLDSNDDDDGR